MMPRLQATEALRAVRVAQVAGGQFAPDGDGAQAAMETLEGWADEAAGGKAKQQVEETTQQKDERRQARALLGGMGVKVIKRPKQGVKFIPQPEEATDGKS